mmetsp:Transcript_1090/g.1733  ORF Transcript_1090/g.1733 Transcript_1090/m.1733 type:complete len:240 (+) Transcript_1090:898-1617(+)
MRWTSEEPMNHLLAGEPQNPTNQKTTDFTNAKVLEKDLVVTSKPNQVLIKVTNLKKPSRSLVLPKITSSDQVFIQRSLERVQGPVLTSRSLKSPVPVKNLSREYQLQVTKADLTLETLVISPELFRNQIMKGLKNSLSLEKDFTLLTLFRNQVTKDKNSLSLEKDCTFLTKQAMKGLKNLETPEKDSIFPTLLRKGLINQVTKSSAEKVPSPEKNLDNFLLTILKKTEKLSQETTLTTK